MKTAIVFSGGGARGAYGAGVYAALARQGFQFDLALGTSTGALLALGAAAGHPDFLEDQYTGVTERDILKKHPIWTLPWRPGLASMKPLRDRIAKNLQMLLGRMEMNGRMALVTTFDYLSGQVNYWKIPGTPENIIPDVVTASCAIPIAIDPIKIDGGLYGDGGVRDGAPLRPLVDLGVERAVVVLHSRGYESPQHPIRKLWDAGQRAVRGLQDEVLENDVELMRLKSRVAGYRPIRLHVYRIPSYHNMGSMEFSQLKMRNLFNDGLDSVQNAPAPFADLD
jgi:NTE family protein